MEPAMMSACFVHTAIKDLPADMPVEQKCEAAMRACLDDRLTWNIHSEDDKFKAGCGALLLLFEHDEENDARVKHELRTLQSLSAMLSGVPVDFAALTADDAPKPLGLLKMFHAAKGTKQ